MCYTMLLIPVSYTHLDVYKRQSKHDEVGITETGDSNNKMDNIVETVRRTE